jgi:hypothetical protein
MVSVGDRELMALPPELAGWATLAERGELTLGLPNEPGLYRRSPLRMPEGTAKRWIDEDRAEHS